MPLRTSCQRSHYITKLISLPDEAYIVTFFVSSSMSSTAWTVLTSLPVCDSLVDHPGLTINGFSVSHQSVSSPVESQCSSSVPSDMVPHNYSVSAVTDQIPGYGYTNDLDDLLCHLTDEHRDSSIYRPPKVIHKIQVCSV